jgi:propanol-preferring alcohol dehydrogenase
MLAMAIAAVTDLETNTGPLVALDLPRPVPAADEVLIRVATCGVCHTELDEIEGRTPPTAFPRVPGHQVVGRVVEAGPAARGVKEGDRVGVAWIFRACGRCGYCASGQENLCPSFEATGRDADGGYAEYMTAPAAFTYPLPDVFADLEAAPLLCAGAIGYRSLALSGLTGSAPLGLMGFGASAHLVLGLAHARHPAPPVFVFARSESERAFARELGAAWTGDPSETPPEPPVAIIDTTPAWTPVLQALRHLAPGGRLVINAIRKEDADRSALATLDYPTQLWREKQITSVANVTRRDVREFLDEAATIPLRPEVQVYPLADANRALVDLAARRIRGAKVLRV